GGNQENAVRIVFRNFGDDTVPDGSVLLNKIQTSFSRTLRGSGGQDRDGGASAIGIVARPNVRRMGKGNRMIEIHGFALSFGAVDVDKDDFRCEPAEQQGISKTCSNVAHSDNGDAADDAVICSHRNQQASTFQYPSRW